jgi:hypothetical protein
VASGDSSCAAAGVVATAGVSARYFPGFGQLVLDAPGQLILALRCDKRVLAHRFQSAVAGNLGGLDRAASDLLAPRDI